MNKPKSNKKKQKDTYRRLESRESTKQRILKDSSMNPLRNIKNRRSQLEIDYAHKLSEKEIQFLADFNEQEIKANPEPNNPRKKQIYAENNARNRDAYSRWIRLPEESLSFCVGQTEDYMIEMLHLKEQLKKEKCKVNTKRVRYEKKDDNTLISRQSFQHTSGAVRAVITPETVSLVYLDGCVAMSTPTKTKSLPKSKIVAKKMLIDFGIVFEKEERS